MGPLGCLRVLWKVCMSAHTRGDALSGDVLRHVAPVRADIGQAARGAVDLGVEAPVPVGIVEQPVLRIGALHHQDFAQVAVFPHAAHVLHHRVEAQVVEGAVAAASFRAASATSSWASATRGGQRLLADHVLARLAARPWPWGNAGRWACRCGRHPRPGLPGCGDSPPRSRGRRTRRRVACAFSICGSPMA